MPGRVENWGMHALHESAELACQWLINVGNPPADFSDRLHLRETNRSGETSTMSNGYVRRNGEINFRGKLRG